MGNIIDCLKGNQQGQRDKVKMAPLLLDHEVVVLQVKMKRDQIARKKNDLQRRIDQSMARIRELAREKRKEEAVYYLGKKRVLEQSLKQISQKLDFVEGRIRNIEQAQDDAEFTDIVKESNQALKSLLDRVDHDAVREANELDQEVNMHNQEVLDAINSGMQDQDVLDEYELLGGNAQPEEADQRATTKEVQLSVDRKDPVKQDNKRELLIN